MKLEKCLVEAKRLRSAMYENEAAFYLDVARKGRSAGRP
jgi:hypothetical protein